MSNEQNDELAIFLAGVIHEVGEVRVPVSVLNQLQGGVFVYYDEDADEIVLTLENPDEN